MTNQLCYKPSLSLQPSQDIRSAHTLYPVMTRIQCWLAHQSIPQPKSPSRTLIPILMERLGSVSLENICVESERNCRYKTRRWEVPLEWLPRKAGCSTGFLFMWANLHPP